MKTSFKAVRAVFIAVFVFMIAFEAGAQRVRLKQLERKLGVPIGPEREWYIGVTDTFGDQRYKRLDTLIAYIADSVDTDTDEQYVDSFYIQDDTLYISLIRGGPVKKVDLTPYLALGDDIQYIDTFYFDMDTLYISLVRDGVGLQKVYLGDLISLADQDKQRADTFFILDNILYHSLQRDSVGANTVDLSPYLDNTDAQYFMHSGTSDYTNELSGSGGTNFTLIGGTNIAISHDGGGNVTITNSLGPDDDWWKVSTTVPPNNSEDAFRTGKTGIGMNPVYLLDVSEDSRIYGHQIGRGGGNLQVNLRLGINALSSNTTGERNLAIGPYALESNTTAHHNLAIGYEALRYNNNEWNTAIGQYSMQLCTDCFDNTAIGYQSMQGAINAQYNTAVGHDAIGGNKYGHGNTAVGDYAMKDDTLAYYNTTMGRFSMRWLSLTRGNTAVGYESLNITNNSGSEYNTVMGFQSMYGALNVSDNNLYNIAIGYQSLYEPVTTMSYNIGMGRKAGSFLDGNMNIAIGDSTLYSGAGDYNIVLGSYNTISADSNVIIGYNQSLSTNGNLLLTNGTGSQFIRMLNTGFVGLGIAAPTQRLHVPGNVRVTGAYYDSNNDPGTAGQVLSSLATGTDWVDATSGGTMSYFFINGNDDAFGNTQVDQGEVITIDGTGGITASLAASGSLSYVIDGSGITGTTNLSITNSANPGLNSSNGSDVIFQDGTGINAVYVNDFTIRFDAADSDPGNEIQTLGWAGAGTMNLTLSGTSPGVYIAPGNAGITLSQVGSTMSIFATDASVSNEGYNGVGSGGSTSSTITSNTTGSNPVTINVAGTLSITEVANANGGSITITGTGGSGTVTSVGLTGTTGIGVSGSPITTSGTLTLSLNNDLQALEGLAGTGIAVRTGAATWANRSLVAGPGIGISMADGVSGNPTITASVINILAGSNINVSSGAGTYTISQPSFTSLTTGLTAGKVVYVGSDGTPEVDASSFTWNATTKTLSIGSLSTGAGITATGGINSTTLKLTGIGTFASDAAAGAGGAVSGDVYKTATGELRIKL